MSNVELLTYLKQWRNRFSDDLDWITNVLLEMENATEIPISLQNRILDRCQKEISNLSLFCNDDDCNRWIPSCRRDRDTKSCMDCIRYILRKWYEGGQKIFDHLNLVIRSSMVMKTESIPSEFFDFLITYYAEMKHIIEELENLKTEARANAEAKAEDEARAKAEDESRAKAEAEARAKAEAEVEVEAEAEARAKAEAEAEAEDEMGAKAEVEANVKEAKVKMEAEEGIDDMGNPTFILRNDMFLKAILDGCYDFNTGILIRDGKKYCHSRTNLEENGITIFFPIPETKMINDLVSVYETCQNNFMNKMVKNGAKILKALCRARKEKDKINVMRMCEQVEKEMKQDLENENKFGQVNYLAMIISEMNSIQCSILRELLE